MTADLRTLLRWSAQRHSEPAAVILDSRTLQSTRGSGHARTPARIEYDSSRRAGPKHHKPATQADDHLFPSKRRISPRKLQVPDCTLISDSLEVVPVVGLERLSDFSRPTLFASRSQSDSSIDLQASKTP